MFFQKRAERRQLTVDGFEIRVFMQRHVEQRARVAKSSGLVRHAMDILWNPDPGMTDGSLRRVSQAQETLS